jgi:actin-related protein 9
MFPAEKEGEFEPYKIRRKNEKPAQPSSEVNDEAPADQKSATEGEEDDVLWEEDRISEEGAIWPIQEGRIVDWPCFYALVTHVYNTLNPPFHTAILLITQPSWTPREHEKLTQFFFEKFKTPAFGLMDAALATSWAYGVHTATVVDVGKNKTDVTAVSEFIPQTQGRVISLSGCGGEAFTAGLMSRLKAKGFNRDMCEQLKRSQICEILTPGTPLPGTGPAKEKDVITNPAAAASTGATSSGPAGAATIGSIPRGPGVDTEVGEDNANDENEGVLDVASIVASGKMSEYLAKKEKEKQDKALVKKKGAPAPDAANRQVRLPNNKREKATFLYEDHALLDTLKNMDLGTQGLADARTALNEVTGKQAQEQGENGETRSAVEANGTGDGSASGSKSGSIKREIEVGTERFLADDGTLDSIAAAVYRTISSVDEVQKRSDLWDNIIICGNGSRLRGQYYEEFHI